MSKCKRFKGMRAEYIYNTDKKIALTLRYKNKANLDYLKWLMKWEMKQTKNYKTKQNI